MKQTLFISALLVATGFTVNAQTEQGNYLVGGNVELNTGKNNTNINLSPTIGYFFVTNFAAGANLDLTYTKIGSGSDAGKTTTFGIGPFVRYYVGTTGVRPFLHGDVNFTTTKFKDGPESTKRTGTSFFIAPGAAFFLNRNVALEALAGYKHVAYANTDGSGGFAFKLGFQVYINRAEVKAVTNSVQ